MMRDAMRRILESERQTELVGEAGSLGQAMQTIADFEVLLHMAEKRDFRPALVKSQLGCVCTLAVSFSNDEEARQLAESCGALALLD